MVTTLCVTLCRVSEHNQSAINNAANTGTSLHTALICSFGARHQNIPDPGPGGDSAERGGGSGQARAKQPGPREREREWAETRHRRTGRQPPENGECRHNDNTSHHLVRRLTNVTRPELIMPVSHHLSAWSLLVLEYSNCIIPPSPSPSLLTFHRLGPGQTKQEILTPHNTHLYLTVAF